MLSLLRGGDGMNCFAHWRDGQRTEEFEPGFSHTEPKLPHPWWDVVQERLAASGEEYPDLVPVLEAVAHYIGAVPDTDTLEGPLLTLCLADSSRTPDPPARRPGPFRPPGRALGPALLSPPPPPSVGRAANVPTTQRPYGTRIEE